MEIKLPPASFRFFFFSNWEKTNIGLRRRIHRPTFFRFGIWGSTGCAKNWKLQKAKNFYIQRFFKTNPFIFVLYVTKDLSAKRIFLPSPPQKFQTFEATFRKLIWLPGIRQRRKRVGKTGELCCLNADFIYPPPASLFLKGNRKLFKALHTTFFHFTPRETFAPGWEGHWKVNTLFSEAYAYGMCEIGCGGGEAKISAVRNEKMIPGKAFAFNCGGRRSNTNWPFMFGVTAAPPDFAPKKVWDTRSSFFCSFSLPGSDI